jgi:hypothetical protein
MGLRVWNFNVFCDYATPDKYSAVESHMELPIPHEDLQKVQGWLGQGEWEAAESYLASKYPQHRALLSEWLAASKARNEGASTPVKLAAVG